MINYAQSGPNRKKEKLYIAELVYFKGEMAAQIHKTKIAKIKTQLMRYMTHEIFLYSKCDT
jgi:hypothetical protein